MDDVLSVIGMEVTQTILRDLLISRFFWLYISRSKFDNINRIFKFLEIERKGMKETFYLNGKEVPTIPVPHDCIVKDIKLKEVSYRNA